MENLKTINFGSNPVNIENAYKQAVESGLDTEHCIIELASNAQDYGTKVDITLNGVYLPSPKGQHKMRLTSVIVKDNGCGMHHDTVLERFRGAYQDSESHSSDIQRGRNGVGVKTSFQYWKNIYVETTTKDTIPLQWSCCPENLQLIDDSYKQLSKLKPGDNDTELRSYNISLTYATCDEPWTTVSHIESGTTVTLKNPRDTVIVDVNEIIRRLSHSIEFLSQKDNKIIVNYMNEKQNPTNTVIKPFYKRNKIPESICHVKGISTNDVFISIVEQQAILFPKIATTEICPIEFDIKITDASQERQEEPNEFIISICGCNVFDTPKRGSTPSAACLQIMSLDKFENHTGFAYRVHGYVKCNDLKLKHALRHNKSAIETQDKYASIFFDYVVRLFKELNKIYVAYLDQFNVNQEDEILKEVKAEFANILSTKTDGTISKSQTDSAQHENKHAEYVCNSCNKTWKVPKMKTPTYCAEYNINGEEGCGSRDISRKTVKTTTPDFKWLPYHGNFLPARYEESTNTIYLAKFHPVFITAQTGKNKTSYIKSAAITQSLIALTIQQSKSTNFEASWCANLKKQFQSKRSNQHTLECIKVWKENNINDSQI